MIVSLASDAFHSTALRSSISDLPRLLFARLRSFFSNILIPVGCVFLYSHYWMLSTYHPPIFPLPYVPLPSSIIVAFVASLHCQKCSPLHCLVGPLPVQWIPQWWRQGCLPQVLLRCQEEGSLGVETLRRNRAALLLLHRRPYAANSRWSSVKGLWGLRLREQPKSAVVWCCVCVPVACCIPYIDACCCIVYGFMAWA